MKVTSKIVVLIAFFALAIPWCSACVSFILKFEDEKNIFYKNVESSESEVLAQHDEFISEFVTSHQVYFLVGIKKAVYFDSFNSRVKNFFLDITHPPPEFS